MATINAIPLGTGEDFSDEFPLATGEYRTLSYFGSETGVIYVEKENTDGSWNNVKGGALSSGNSPFDLRADGNFRLHRMEDSDEAAADFD